MNTWTDRVGHTSLRSFTDERNKFWLEQNPVKNTKSGKLTRAGHAVAWEFASPGGAYTGWLTALSTRQASSKNIPNQEDGDSERS